MSTASPADVSHLPALTSPMSCQSFVSCDSSAACSTVMSSSSVHSFDDLMETDTNCRPSSADGSLERSLSSRCRDSLYSVPGDEHSSSAANNLDSAYQEISILPPSQDKQLMMEVYGKLPFVYLLWA